MEIVGQSMCTDLPDSFTGRSFLGLCGYTMSKRAAHLCLQQAGLTIKDVDIIELHDCFSPNEVYRAIPIVKVVAFRCKLYSQSGCFLFQTL